MKNIIILYIASILLFSCSTNDDKAKKAVTEFLKTELDDYKRYEPVSWGALDSAINVIDEEPFYKELKGQTEYYEKYISELEDSIKTATPLKITEYEGMKAGASARLQQEKTKLDRYTSNYKSGFVGWKIEHTYRAPNKIGALELETDVFIIEPDFSKADYRAILIP